MIGRELNMKCYDGNMHLCRVTDVLVVLSGNTYEHKDAIYLDGFKYNGFDKIWCKNAETDEEAMTLFDKWTCEGVTVMLKPIYRIVG